MPTLKSVMKAASNPVLWYRRRTMQHTPRNLFVFLTNVCNLHCEHCFYHYELNKKVEEISVEQLAKLGRSLTQPTFICLTGGEVTLRKDLTDAAMALIDSKNVYYVNVCTNGFYLERIQSLSESIIKDGRLARLGFQISLDGLEDMHNSVRKHPLSYRRAMESLRYLKGLQIQYPDRLQYGVHAVLTRHNIGQAVELLHETQKEGFPVSFSIVRSSNDVFDLDLAARSGFDVKDEESTLGVDNALWRSTVNRLYSVREQYGYDYPNETGSRKLNVVLDTLENRHRMIPCDAGKHDGVIYPNGDVAHCENSSHFANLTDFDYDLQALWHSDAANAMRQRIQTCACTHGCNIINSLLARPDIYPVDAANSTE